MVEKSVLVLQHIDCEGPGLVEKALRARGLPLHTVHGYRGEDVPREAAPWAGLLVLGGPMNADEVERYPFIEAERNLLQHALHDEIPILGLCLGAQLLARVLGAPVYRAKRPEVGFLRIDRSDEAYDDPLFTGFPSFAQVFQWHNDTFDLPLGATRLASSRLCENQAFRWGERAWGLQFHLEVTPPMVFQWIETYQREIARNPDIDAGQIKAHARDTDRFTELARLAQGVFGAWANLLI